MKKMGISQHEIDAEEVIIRCGNKNLVIKQPSVVRVNMMGEDSFQISGEVVEEAKEDSEKEPEISDDDIKTVMEQASVSREEAEEALKQSKGDLAEAILLLKK